MRSIASCAAIGRSRSALLNFGIWPNFEISKSAPLSLLDSARSMHDLAADVKVEIYVDGKPLGEAAARGSSTVSFVESAAGKEFSVALEYLGRKLFGHWALVVVDGVAMEGYTLTPNVREVCAGKLSSNGQSRSRLASLCTSY